MDEQEQQTEEQPSEERQTFESTDELQTSPSSPPPSHKKLIISIAVVFVLVVIGTVGAYFVSQLKGQPVDDVQPVGVETEVEEVSSWNTYRNEEYGFELQYPKLDYFQATTIEGGMLLFDLHDTSAFVIQIFDKSILGDLSENSEDIFPKLLDSGILGNLDCELTFFDSVGERTTIENDCFDNLNFDYTGYLKRYLPFEEILSVEIGRQVSIGASLSISAKDEVFVENFYVVHLGENYILIASVTGSSLGVYCPEKYLSDNCPSLDTFFTEMLDSIKFIEPQASVDTSNWKTYRNEEYGFEMSLPENVEGLAVLDLQNENNNPDFAYNSFYGYSSEAYNVLFEVQPRDVLSSFSFSLLKYRDNILLKYESLGGGGAIEEANLKELKNLIEGQGVGNYSAAGTESGYFDVDSNILALQEYEIIQDNTNNRKIRKYEIRKRGQTGCIPSDLIYEFFENDYYAVFQITQDECYNTTFSHPTLDQILSTFKFIEP